METLDADAIIRMGDESLTSKLLRPAPFRSRPVLRQLLIDCEEDRRFGRCSSHCCGRASGTPEKRRARPHASPTADRAEVGQPVKPPPRCQWDLK